MSRKKKPPKKELIAGMFDRRPRFFITVFSAFVALLLAWGCITEKSVTVDEFPALPHGLAILKTGAFHLCTGVPPLPTVLPAIPLLFSSAKFDLSHFSEFASMWRCGREFASQNATNYHHYFVVGRLVSVLVLLLTVIISWGFARSLYGPAGGFVATVFVIFSPNLLGHGTLITPDIYLTAAIVGSLWAFDYHLRRPGWVSALALGFGMGTASLCKLTGVLLFAILPFVLVCMWAVQRFRKKPIDPQINIIGSTWTWAVVALIFGLLVINIGYLGDRAFIPLEDYQFKTPAFQTIQSSMPGWLPVPLPYYFFMGFDAQLADSGYAAYLLGEFNARGFPHYYMVGFLVKTPLPVLALCALSLWYGRRLKPREVPLVVTAVLMFCFFSFATHKNIGIRYLLFLFPLMGIWIARLTTTPQWNSPKRSLVAWGVALGAACQLVTAIVVWPDYLAYFNLASGGSANGHKYLLDSNLDWGQDLITLREYMNKEKIDSLDLAYFGRVNPGLYGIKYKQLGTGKPERYAAISANLLWGRMYFVNGGQYWPKDKNTYAYLRPLKPKIVLGHTIYVYDMHAQNR